MSTTDALHDEVVAELEALMVELTTANDQVETLERRRTELYAKGRKAGMTFAALAKPCGVTTAAVMNKLKRYEDG